MKCPRCRSDIHEQAKRCCHCKEWLGWRTVIANIETIALMLALAAVSLSPLNDVALSFRQGS
jgi:hypothetical protein